MKDVKVLIVDDSKTVQIVIGEVLSNQLGIKDICYASNGVEALEMLKSKPVDFIISDWNMPELSGEELLYEVRQNSDWSDIPFVMMSANQSRDFIITAIQLGVSDYIVKPCKPDELEAVVRKAWGKSKKFAAARVAALPPHSLTIALGNVSVRAELVKINRAAMLLRMEYSSQLKLFEEYKSTIKIHHPDFPNLDGLFEIGPLGGVLRRIEAEDTLKGTSTMCFLSLYLGSVKIEAEVEKALNRLLLWIKNQSAGYIED